jgi:hypothetical protein
VDGKERRNEELLTKNGHETEIKIIHRIGAE